MFTADVRYGVCCISVLFADYFERNFYRNFFVKIYCGVVIADFLDCFRNNDVLAVNVESEFFESFSDLDSID